MNDEAKTLQNVLNNLDLYGCDEIHLPYIDPNCAKVIDYLFYRLRGCLNALTYSADCQATLDAIKREWTYHFKLEYKRRPNKLLDIDQGIVALKDSKAIFLPPVQAFIEMCREKSSNAAHREYDPSIKNDVELMSDFKFNQKHPKELHIRFTPEEQKRLEELMKLL